MIAGPNGSGKSTLIHELKKHGINLGEYFNADDIARTMQGNPASVATIAQSEVRRLRQSALEGRRSHSFETVLSHPSHIDHLRLARAAGFRIIVYFVATDHPLISIGRVENRVRHGGHDVPHDRIESRYYRSLANLPAALLVAHEATIFDNSSSTEPMRPVAEWNGREISHQMPLGTWPRWWKECFPGWNAAAMKARFK